MNEYQKKISALEKQILPERVKKLKKTVENRTRHFCMVLEDLKNPHNISAIIRTSEVFGFQDIHIIEELNNYKISKSILKGSFKWLSLYMYSKREHCIQKLKKNGYQIAIASTHAVTTLHEIEFTKPTAFYLGSEVLGHHPETQAQADILFKIPQYGLTESMNVSVCGGVLMSTLNQWMEKKGREYYTLNTLEKEKLLANFYEISRLGIEANSPLIYHKEN